MRLLSSTSEICLRLAAARLLPLPLIAPPRHASARVGAVAQVAQQKRISEGQLQMQMAMAQSPQMAGRSAGSRGLLGSAFSSGNTLKPK